MPVQLRRTFAAAVMSFTAYVAFIGRIGSRREQEITVEQSDHPSGELRFGGAAEVGKAAKCIDQRLLHDVGPVGTSIDESRQPPPGEQAQVGSILDEQLVLRVCVALPS
jgi:hypothetical protein